MRLDISTAAFSGTTWPRVIFQLRNLRALSVSSLDYQLGDPNTIRDCLKQLSQLETHELCFRGLHRVLVAPYGSHTTKPHYGINQRSPFRTTEGHNYSVQLDFGRTFPNLTKLALHPSHEPFLLLPNIVPYLPDSLTSLELGSPLFDLDGGGRDRSDSARPTSAQTATFLMARPPTAAYRVNIQRPCAP